MSNNVTHIIGTIADMFARTAKSAVPCTLIAVVTKVNNDVMVSLFDMYRSNTVDIYSGVINNCTRAEYRTLHSACRAIGVDWHLRRVATMLNLIYTPNPNAIRNPDQHRGALWEVSKLMERPRLTTDGVARLSALRVELDNYAWWAFPDPAILTKIYFANPILAHYGIGLEYFLTHHHTLSTVATTEETMIARADAAHDYPQDYLPLLPKQARISAALELLEELGEVEYSTGDSHD